MFHARTVLAVTIVSLFPFAGVDAAIFRVPGDFAILENAVAAAADGDTVRVAGNGGSTYRARLAITRPLLLEGGWRADFQVRDPSIYVSVIRSPQDQFEFDRPVIQVQSASGVVIDGFTIVNGRTGIDATNSNLVIRRCDIRGQQNRLGGNPQFNRSGGCVRVGGGSATLDRVVLREALCDFGGAGLAVASAGNVTVIDSRIQNHLSARFGVVGSGACILCEDSGTLRLERTTVSQGATANDAGLMLVRNSSLVAIDCDFTEGAASISAGGIQLLDCPLVQFTNCTVADCSSNSKGGGLDVQRCGSLAMIGCTIQRNVTKFEGGGMRLLDTPFAFSDCLFSNNNRNFFPLAIAVRGGGVRSQASSGSATRCCFVQERADGWGGGWAQVGGDITFVECVFDESDSKVYGGGFHIELAGSARFERSLLRGCTAKFGGAVAASFTGLLELDRCTLVENVASTTGGAVFGETAATLRVTSSILCRAPRGDLVSCASAQFEFASSNVWNDESVNTRTEFAGGCSDPTGQNGNLSVDPIFCPLPGSPPFCDVGLLAYALDPSSPCAGQGVGGVDMGWQDAGCGTQSPVQVESDSWGKIKSRYRTP